MWKQHKIDLGHMVAPTKGPIDMWGCGSSFYPALIGDVYAKKVNQRNYWEAKRSCQSKLGQCCACCDCAYFLLITLVLTIIRNKELFWCCVFMPLRAKWPMEPALISVFCSVMRMRGFFDPLPGWATVDGTLIHRRLTPSRYWYSFSYPRKDGKLSELRRKRRSHKYSNLWYIEPCAYQLLQSSSPLQKT